jgi:hypothetical protein
MLRKIKAGELTYQTVANGLETLMDEVEDLASKSTLPEKVNVRAVEDLLFVWTREYIETPIL